MNRTGSLASRLSAEFQRQYGRPADANDPAFATWVQTALPTMIQSDADAYQRSKNRWNVVKNVAMGAAAIPFAMAAAPAIGGMFGGGAASGAAGGASGAAGAAGAAGAGMTAQTGLGIGQILSGLFGNIWGARQQAGAANRATDAQAAAMQRAAELEKQALDEALAYQKEIDARDYQNWLTREARDYRDQWAMTKQGRRDWEASEQRKQPYRALGDAAVRTLADYIRVPGMRQAQPVDVPIMTYDPYVGEDGQPPAWLRPGGMPASTTMPVGQRTRTVADLMRTGRG